QGKAASSKHQAPEKVTSGERRVASEQSLRVVASRLSCHSTLATRHFVGNHHVFRDRSFGSTGPAWPMGSRRSLSSLKPSSSHPACSGESNISFPSFEGASFCPGGRPIGESSSSSS